MIGWIAICYDFRIMALSTAFWVLISFYYHVSVYPLPLLHWVILCIPTVFLASIHQNVFISEFTELNSWIGRHLITWSNTSPSDPRSERAFNSTSKFSLNLFLSSSSTVDKHFFLETQNFTCTMDPQLVTGTKILTEEEASRYDRQMRLWGLEAQQRCELVSLLRNTQIL